jgi:DNA polymerase III delta prime subunit
MNEIYQYDPLKTKKLIAHGSLFKELIELHEIEKLPRVMLFTGKKGIGKFTLVNHFLNYVFTKATKHPYSFKKKELDSSSIFYNSLLNGSSQNVIFFNRENKQNVKIDDIRNLKSQLSKSSLVDRERFIIIDEVEFLNVNCVNALLKILEEPSSNNYFILISNEQKKILDTLLSRCSKTKVYLSSIDKNNIIDHLTTLYDIEISSTFNTPDVTPGLFLRYNEILQRNKIDSQDNIFSKINKLLYVYKKNKDKTVINLCNLLVEQHFYQLAINNNNRVNLLVNLKISILKNINDFVEYNLNINSVINTIENKLNNG